MSDIKDMLRESGSMLKSAVECEIAGRLSTPAGRQQLRQMIEEAEKQAPQTLDDALKEYGRAYAAAYATHSHVSGRVRLVGLEVFQDLVKAAAQREYGHVDIGQQQSDISATLDDRRSDWCWLHIRGSRYQYYTWDIPGILYALSTLQEETK